MLVIQLIVLAIFIAASEQAAVKVTVYYESLCSDSAKFITRQVYPAWLALGSDYMLLDFVPYGKGNHSQTGNWPGGWRFDSQHGIEEYLGNKLQACGLKALESNADGAVTFVTCIMLESKPYTLQPACSRLLTPLTLAKIDKCYMGVEGDRLLVRHGDRTHAAYPAITLHPDEGFVPQIEFNQVYNKDDQIEAFDSLTKAVCKKIAGMKPEACNT